MQMMFGKYVLDTEKPVKVVTVSGHQSIGKLADVDYGEDREDGTPVLTIEQDGLFFSFYMDDVASIEAVEIVL